MAEGAVAFSRPVIEQDEIDEVVACLRSGWITTGPRALRFEEMFRDRLGVPHAVAVNSATAGLHLVMAALGIGAGDEVIVPSLTWASTANVVELLGARAVLADVDGDTLQIDPAEVARLAGPRTRAVVAVHYAGAPADLDALRAIARDRGIPLIEDAAHAVGTFHRGVEVGSDSFAAVFSFHPIKNITTGEGGMIVCRDDELARRLRLLRNHGVSRDAWKRYGQGGSPQYEVLEPGFKYNMMDIQAALGLCQLPKLDRFNAERARLAERYDRLLAEVAGIRPIGRVPYPHTHAWHLYIVRVDADGDLSGARRDEVIAALAEEGVSVGLHFPALHVQSYYRDRYGLKPGDLPRAAAAGAEIMSLPLYPGLGEDEQERVVAALARAVGKRRQAA